MHTISKNKQYYKFCFYGFLKNLRFFDAFFILFLIEKGLSFTEIGSLYAIREIFINVFEIPSGIIADTYGRKNSLITSFFAYIISFYIFYTSYNFWIFILAFIFYGIGDAFRTGTHKGMIMDYLKLNNWSNQKIQYYGHTRSCSQKGSAISSLLAGLIVFYSGSYQSIFLYSIIPYIFNLILIFSYPKELNFSSKKKSDKNKIATTFLSFFKTIKQPNVLRIINTSAVHSAYLQSVKDYIQPLMVNVAIILPFMLNIDADKKNGLVIGIIYFLIYIANSRASKIASKYSNFKNGRISYYTLLFGFSFGLLTGLFFYYNLWVLSLLTFVGIFLVENIRKPILTGFISDNVSNDILTSVISAQSQLKTIITATLAFTFGVIADNFGIGISIAVVSVILLFISLILNIFSNNLSSK